MPSKAPWPAVGVVYGGVPPRSNFDADRVGVVEKAGEKAYER